jgi:hypothetical protein
LKVEQEDLVMRNVPGWIGGALGAGALVAAFYAGGRARAVAVVPADAATEVPVVSAQTAPFGLTAALTPTAFAHAEVAVECEPGQRAVVNTSAAGAPRVSCVSDPRPVGLSRTASYAPATVTEPAARVVYVNDAPERPRARPAVISEPVEVYRPRSVPVSYPSRDEVERPPRSVKKSVAIIAGSTAAGAVVGGLAKGKKGAVIGGIVGGGAATVWDQVTRRRDDDRR